jgi:glycosyltransferase involved in cell wall biosynthesis
MEPRYRRLLASAAWAEERLVVDTGSTDGTAELAAAAGARVLRHEWLGYGATKDWAFEQAEGEWVLSLDADERVSEALAPELRRLADATDHAAFGIPRRFYFLGRWLKHGGCYPDPQLRFFRRGRARYGAELVHERLRVDGTTVAAAAGIHSCESLRIPGEAR